MATSKVFGIGFHKTGTTSLEFALRELGYSVTGPNGVDDPDIATNALPLAYRLAEQFDAFQDNPWPVVYKELDERYPGSRFILTLRPTEPWIRSVLGHFGRETTPMREWIYGAGCPEGHEEVYISRYEAHSREVLDYFRERPDDLLRLRLTEGEGWEKLCPFLGKDIPSVPFPHEKKAGGRRTRSVIAGVRSLLSRLTGRA